MNILVLSRQQAALAPFHDWLGPAISHARLFTTPDQASGHSGFAEIRTFEAYETTALIDLEVVRLHRTWPIDRIIATSEVDILRAGRLRTRLGLAGQSGPSALAFRN
ncbi:MAG TPA: hypothetical protein VD886_22125, partial [Herpetosiphonaceae bacterium]|nr:hypothetical protein [Herpetosiphonaceae bacterium]